MPSLLVITTHAHEPNFPIERKILADYIFINLSYMLKHKDTQTLKVENWQKIYLANINPRKLM